MSLEPGDQLTDTVVDGLLAILGKCGNSNVLKKYVTRSFQHGL